MTGFIVVAAGLLVGGCCGGAEPATIEVAAPPVTKQQPIVVESSVTLYGFRGDRLSECFTTTASKTAATPEEVPATRAVVEPVLAKVRTMPNMVEGDRPCNELFADRLPLATCAVTAHNPEGVAVTHAMSCYDFELCGADDSYLEMCSRLKGVYSAVRRDSHEWRTAKSQYDIAKLLNQL